MRDRAAKVSLKLAIKKEKARAWKELLQTLEEDPWGCLYKIVLNKLKPWELSLTESLDPGFVREMVDILFPRMDGEETPPGPLVDYDEVGAEELHEAIKRGQKHCPGP